MSMSRVEDQAGNQENFSQLLRAEKIPNAQREFIENRLLATQFGNMVAILMQSPHHQNIPLMDLRNHIVPPLVKNQFRMVEARKSGTGIAVPVALALWAQVSDEIHERLIAPTDASISLKADDWSSGNNFWLVDLVGPERFVKPLMAALKKTVFAGRDVYYRSKGEAGVSVSTLTKH